MKKFSLIIVSSLVIAGIVFLALPANTVSAQEVDPPEFERERQRGRSGLFFPRSPIDLERIYWKLVDRYEDVGYRIKDTDDVTRKLEYRITDLIEAGEDPTDLEAILATFEENMETVQAAHEEVGDIIAEHAGFNDDGEVEEESVALLTLRQIGESLLDVRQLREDARYELRWDLMELRYQNQSEE
ncbi:MAG: hypothetical protein ACOCYU_02585 [Brevefilum sp.]